MNPLLAGACNLELSLSLGNSSEPLWLAGFAPGRTARGVQDPLRVRAVVLEQGSRRVAWVSLDLIGLFASTLDRVRAHPRIQELFLDPLLITCTHTHSGPDTLGFWSPPDTGACKELLAEVESRIVEAVWRASRRLVPVRARHAQTRAGKWMRDTLPPVVIDDRLRALSLVDPSGRAVATLVHWGNHAESLPADQERVSADFPGALCRRVEQQLGGAALFLPGAIGGGVTPRGTDLEDPRSGRLLPQDSPRRAAVLGGRLAERLLRVIPASPVQEASLQADLVRVPVPVSQAGLAQRCSAHATPRFLGPDQRQVEAECALIQLGDLSILTTPGEPYPELVLGGVTPRGRAEAWDLPPLQEILPDPLWVVSLTNGSLGYAVPPTQWPDGPASNVLSPGPGFAGALVQAARDLAAGPRTGKGIPCPPTLLPLAESRR